MNYCEKINIFNVCIIDNPREPFPQFVVSV